VVDDDRDAADSTADVLTLLGFSATPAYSAEQALRLAAAAPPDAVVSDVRMPTDGCALARALAAAPVRPRLVAVTGEHGADERCRAAGFEHVLLKPADPLRLAALLAAPAH
jgi:CheY-like chemotaxis protein